MSRNVTMLSKRLGIKSGLFEQQKQLDASPTAQAQLAEKSLTGTSVLESSRTFYDFMTGDSADKRAYVCNGTACECAGQQADLKARLQSELGAAEVAEMTCLGHCYAGGAFMLDGQTYDIEDLDDALSETQSEQALIPEGHATTPSILLNPCSDINSWYAPVLDAISNQSTNDLLDELIAANLRGRGGAGFPAGIKWRGCRDYDADEKYIVCNADEGDPGAFSDRYLLERHPHSVIYGMLLAGAISGAREGIIYLRLEYPKAIEVCRKAIDELQEAGILSASLN
ncbi:MAG: formate dehydrogenase, partial [Gammaproteobacteria bacterium]|nr:formate dehydrogenase [Gammaproteobacteria bacterium]